MIEDMKIFEMLQHPIWVKDDNNKLIFLNSRFKEEFNLSKDYEHYNLIKELEFKEEYKSLFNSIMNHIDNADGKFYYKDKLYKYSVSVCDEDNKKILVGTILNISDIVNEDETLMLRTVIDNLPSIVFYKDKDLRYMRINKECEKFFNEKGVYEIIGKNDLEFPIDSRFKEACYEHDKMVLDSKEPLYIEEKILSPAENMYKTFQTIKTPIFNKKNEVIGLVGVVRDVTHYKINEEKLTYLSYTDQLTSLYNRFYFNKKIKGYVKKEVFPIGIIFGDVNGLKLVNDTFGHNDGDKYLKEISSCIKECCNKRQIAFRLGGDEFCIISPRSSSEECTTFINKLNNHLASKKFNNIEMSISLGSSLLEKGDNIASVLSKAEDKVYMQKILNEKSVRISTLNSLKSNLHKKNIETEEHTQRVVSLCKEIGKEMNFSDQLIDELILAAELHDIGKISIPDNILLKQSRLTEDEFEIMKTHSEKGYRLALLLPEISHVARAILTHHERWDGTGYPLGLKGEEIPLIARIISIVDSYDAMINDRIYSKAISEEEAIAELRRCVGKQFDPYIVDIFCKIKK